MHDVPPLEDLLEVAVDAARQGGARTLEWFQKPYPVERKSDGSEVTPADRDSERAIREAIERRYPGHAILGEEGGASGGEERVRWIVDPIDGTRSFVRGVPLYGVLVAVEIEGDARVGVIHLPALGETVAAAAGLGCTWNGVRCRVSTRAALDQALVVVTDERHIRETAPGYAELARRTAFQRTWADCYGYALVATGRAEIALDPWMRIWDSAPLLPILQEAGGRFTDWSGQARISGPDALGSNGLLHAEALALLAR